MSARVQGLILGLGNAKQADIATASASFLRFKKIDTTLTSPHPVTENDAAEVGKGNEFIGGVYPVNYDVANRIEKFASAEFVAWAWAYALGNVVQPADANGIFPAEMGRNGLTASFLRDG